MTLIGASLLMGILGTLCPKKHQKHLRLLSGLCMVSLLIAPLPSYLGEIDALLPNWQEEIEGNAENIYEEIYHQTLSAVNVKQMEDMTKNHIIQAFLTKDDDISVSISVDDADGEILLKKVTIGIGGSAVTIDPRDIRDCVEKLLDCPCEIVYR